MRSQDGEPASCRSGTSMVQAKAIVGINVLRQKAACHVQDPERRQSRSRKEREMGCS